MFILDLDFLEVTIARVLERRQCNCLIDKKDGMNSSFHL